MSNGLQLEQNRPNVENLMTNNEGNAHCRSPTDNSGQDTAHLGKPFLRKRLWAIAHCGTCSCASSPCVHNYYKGATITYYQYDHAVPTCHWRWGREIRGRKRTGTDIHWDFTWAMALRSVNLHSVQVRPSINGSSIPSMSLTVTSTGNIRSLSVGPDDNST